MRLYQLERQGRSSLAAIPVVGDVHGLQICYRSQGWGAWCNAVTV